MKRFQILILAAGILVCHIPSVFAAEAAKKDSYKDRLEKQAESYTADGKKTDKEEAPQYPLATRAPAVEQGTASLAKLRNQMVNAFEKGKDEEAQIAADKLELEAAANANDRATAIQVKLLLVTKKDNDNHAAAIPLLEDAIKADGLSNNIHYGMMRQLAQRYLIELDYQNALDMSNRFISETKAEPKEILSVKGNALYRVKRAKDAMQVLEKVYALDPTDTAVAQMLARTYAETGQLDKAAQLTKNLSQTTGNDPATKINLAITYRDAKQYAEAADVIAELRAKNQLLEERDYLTAMNIYDSMKNKEADMIAVVQEGLDKGILKPSVNNYNVLAEAYYYSNRADGMSKAIQNWSKAAPLSKDGKVYLNLSIVQCQEEMWAPCRESAKNAIAKGGINANDAKVQISKADKGLAPSK